MTRESRVVVSVDNPAIKRAIAETAAPAINEAAHWLRDVRDYVDEMAASVARCRGRHDDRECSTCVERGAIVEDLRRLLPTVPEAAGEVGDVVEDRDL